MNRIIGSKYLSIECLFNNEAGGQELLVEKSNFEKIHPWLCIWHTNKLFLRWIGLLNNCFTVHVNHG